jgi:signal transduction histidine kinase
MASLPVRPILDWAVESTGAAPGDVSIECDALLHGYVDPDRLEQIITNLVSNAVEHGATPFAISARPLLYSEGVTIVVSDQGKGVGAEDAERLFDRFGALASRTSSSTGLGLSISRDLARAMGGELIYRRLTAGSSFVLTLPDTRPTSTEELS